MSSLAEIQGRLQRIYRDCGGAGEQPKSDKARIEPKDAFSKLRRELHRKVIELRQSIRERDELLEKNPTSTSLVRKSQEIRRELREIRELHAQLISAHEACPAVKRKETRRTKEDTDTIAAQEEVIDVVRKHIEECSALEKRRYAERSARGEATTVGTRDRTSLFASRSRPAQAGGLGTELPEIDGTAEEGMQVLRQQDAEIDEKLDIISEHLSVVHRQVTGIHDELELQSQVISNIQSKMDKAETDVKDNSRRTRELVTRMRGGDKILVDLILILVLLALMGVAYKLI
jgi:chromosome segregation ATPase